MLRYYDEFGLKGSPREWVKSDRLVVISEVRELKPFAEGFAIAGLLFCDHHRFHQGWKHLSVRAHVRALLRSDRGGDYSNDHPAAAPSKSSAAVRSEPAGEELSVWAVFR